jgi:hypothetical protein
MVASIARIQSPLDFLMNFLSSHTHKRKKERKKICKGSLAADAFSKSALFNRTDLLICQNCAWIQLYFI